MHRSPATPCGHSILPRSRHATLSVRNPHRCKSRLKGRGFWGQSHQLPRLEEARPFILSSSKGLRSVICSPWRVSGPSYRPEPGSVGKVYGLVGLQNVLLHSIKAGSASSGSRWLSACLRIGRWGCRGGYKREAMTQPSWIPFFFFIISSLSFLLNFNLDLEQKLGLGFASHTYPYLLLSLTLHTTSTSTSLYLKTSSLLYIHIPISSLINLFTQLYPRCLSLKPAIKLRLTLDLSPCLESKPLSSRSPTQRQSVVSPSRHHNVAPAPTPQLYHP